MRIFQLLERAPFIRVSDLLQEAKILGVTQGGMIRVWMKYDDGRELAVNVKPKNLKMYTPPNRGRDGGQIGEPPEDVEVMDDIPDHLIHQIGKFTMKQRGSAVLDLLARRKGASGFAGKASVKAQTPRSIAPPVSGPAEVPQEPVKSKRERRLKLGEPIVPKPLLRAPRLIDEPPKDKPKKPELYEPMPLKSIMSGPPEYEASIGRWSEIADRGKLSFDGWFGGGVWGAGWGRAGDKDAVWKPTGGMGEIFGHRNFGKMATAMQRGYKRLASYMGKDSMVPSITQIEITPEVEKKHSGLKGKKGQACVVMEHSGRDTKRVVDCTHEEIKKVPEDQRLIGAVCDLLMDSRDRHEKNAMIGQDGRVVLIDNNNVFDYGVEKFGGKRGASVFYPGRTVGIKGRYDNADSFPPKIRDLLVKLSGMKPEEVEAFLGFDAVAGEIKEDGLGKRVKKEAGLLLEQGIHRRVDAARAIARRIGMAW